MAEGQNALRRTFLVIFFLLVFPLFAGYEEIEDTCKLKVLTPSLSCRKTAKIRLTNGLSAYLVSDEKAEGSAAALSVRSGHWSDPKEYPGMAHLVEHLLFMGTKAYPGENEFMTFVGDSGGKCNAYTSSEKTVYLFSIHHEQFEEGLDRFAHFFIDPLLDSSSVKRELQNVDQEHAKNIENDSWRKYMILKETGNPLHPNRSFSTGNAETLSRIPNDVLRSWLESHYSANLMDLIVYSSLPLETLKEKVDSLFSQIPNRGLDSLTVDQELTSPSQKGRLIAIKPVKNLQILSLEWELPAKLMPDESKSAKLIAYALRRGGVHSLSEILKKEGLIQELDVGVEPFGRKNALFVIECELTPKGILERNTVIERCFQALKAFQKTGIPLYLFQEMTEMAKRSYEFQTRVEPFEFVSEVIGEMGEESLSSFPQKTVLGASYDSEKIQLFLNHLTPKNGQFFLLADPQKTSIAPKMKEKWMGAEYSMAPLPEDLLKGWEKTKIHPSIKLPEKNPFLPTNLPLLEIQDTKARPVKLMDNPYAKAFYLKDTESPHVALHFHLQSPLLDPTPKATVLSELYLLHLQEASHHLLSTAGAAGLFSSFSFDHFRLHLTVQGYNEKAGLFVEEILQTMKGRSPSRQEFENYKERLLRAYGNREKDLPLAQGFEILSSLLREKAVAKEKLHSLQNLSFEEFLFFHKNLFQTAFLETFLAGHFTAKEAEEILLDAVHLLNYAPYPKEERMKEKVFSLPEQKGPFMSSHATSSQGHAAILLLEGGNFSFSQRASQEVLASALKESFFDTLRTKQKTGYIVQSSAEEIERKLFHIFSVQSNTHHPQDLLLRFEVFLEDFHEQIRTYIPQERFEGIKKHLTTSLKNQGRSLDDRAARGDLLAFRYDEDFEWIEKRIQGIESLSYEELIQYTESVLSKENRRRLAILFRGKAKEFVYEEISLLELKDLPSKK